MGALGQLLDRLAVGDVPDEEAKLIQGGDVLGDGLKAGQKEIADGEVRADAVGQEVPDLGSQFPGAVVYDVMGHDAFPFGRKCAIMWLSICPFDGNT